MNTRLRSALLTASIISACFGAVMLTACSEEKCKAIVCANGSVCSEGGCICPSGYEGPQCETTNRDRFLGLWQVSEDGSISASAQYGLSIEKNDLITEVKIKNFRNYYTDNVKARVKGDTMYIDPQAVNGATIQGIGYITKDIYYGANGKMIVKYQVAGPNGLIDDYGFTGNNPSIWNK